MSKKALIVDNDFFFVEFLGELLEKRGYQITKAYDGKEGLLRLDDGPYDILVADLIMPKIDGIQLIKVARSKSSDTPCRIIAASGTVVEQMDELQEAGADCFIAKGPLEQMAVQINDILDRIEKGGMSRADGSPFFEPGTLFPREVTGELIDSLNFHKAVLESIGFGVVVVDRDARIINATYQALSIMHTSSEDALNKHVTALFRQRDRMQIVHAMKKVATDRRLKRVCLNIATEGPETRLTVSLLRLGGDIAGWVIAMQEISE